MVDNDLVNGLSVLCGLSFSAHRSGRMGEWLKKKRKQDWF